MYVVLQSLFTSSLSGNKLPSSSTKRFLVTKNISKGNQQMRKTITTANIMVITFFLFFNEFGLSEFGWTLWG